MKITMDCPGGCNGTGKVKSLRRRCQICHGHGKITLTKYHKVLGNIKELKNVLAYEEHLTENVHIHAGSVSN
jgi:RecJ-like exonuclease